MRSLTLRFAVLVVASIALVSLAHAQGVGPGDKRAEAAPVGATREEVQQLRKEVAAQRQMIEALKAMLQQLVEAKQPAAGAPRLLQVSAVQPESTATSEAIALQGKQAAPKKETQPGLQAGWNGEHFFLKSADGGFNIQPYGYLQADYRGFSGDGVPKDNFVLRRARFGFQGTLGKHYEFAFLVDSADTTPGILVRDFYLNIKYRPEIQFQFGQFKEPFAQEEMIAASNLDFVERSLASLLYPSPASFRSPGIAFHGDLRGGVVQYWVGAFNGKGTLAANTTNEPEVIGRLRFYPWRNTSRAWLKGFAFGGAAGHGRSRGLSNEQSFNGALPEGTFAFFPRFRINGAVERYNGEITWTSGRWAVRGEYDQLDQFRRGLGRGSTDLPGVVGKGFYAQATYLLTGENRPENGAVRPKRPFLTTEGARGIGAWELKFRYSKIQAKTSSTLPALRGESHADEFSVGANWYPTYFVRYMVDFNVERARDRTVGGAPPQKFFVALQRLQFRF